jgi:hypothetical protein
MRKYDKLRADSDQGFQSEDSEPHFANLFLALAGQLVSGLPLTAMPDPLSYYERHY